MNKTSKLLLVGTSALMLGAMGLAQVWPVGSPQLPSGLEIEKNVLAARLAELMTGWHLQVPPKPNWQGPATRITVFSNYLHPDLINSLDALTHGYKDCENTFLCLGGTSYFPIPVRIITGAGYSSVFYRMASWERDRLPFSLSGRRAETYLNINSPKGAIWLVEHPKGDYIITGGLVDGRGGSGTVVRSPKLAMTMMKQMMIDTLVKQKGMTLWEP